MLVFRKGKVFFSGSKYCLAVMLFILTVLSLLPSLGASEEGDGSKPKRLRFEVTSSALRDNRTGLMWTLNADLAARTFSWDGAQDYIVRMNLDRFGGYRDWRMPSLEEIASLLEHVKISGFNGASPGKSVCAGLLGMGVLNVQSDGYWTATTNIYYSAEAWYVSMVDGSPSVGDKTLYFSLWPVRSIR